MKVKPLNDRVLVKADEAEEKTSSGLYLPESAREKPQTSTVVAVGPGNLNEDGERTPLVVKIGDKVVYASYAGTEVELDGEKHTILREADLLAIVSD